MSHPAYSCYQELDIAWNQSAPDHWLPSKLKYDSYIKARVGWHGLKSDEFTDEGPYLVTGSDFSGQFINWNACYHCDAERYEQDPYIQLKENDLLITKDGTIGKVILTGILPDRATLNSGVFVLRPLNNRYKTKFYYWVMQSSIFHGFVEYYRTGSTIQHLYQETFCNIPYALPPIEEQLSIANFLNHETAKIDELIAKQERLIDLLKEKMLSLALTPFQSGKGFEVRLGSVVEIIRRPVQQQPEELYVPLGLYNRGRGLFHKEPREKDDMGDSDFFWIKEGDLILSGQFAWEGAVALAEASENDTVVSHRYPVLRGKRGKALTEYIYALFLSRHGDFLLNENSRGAAGRNRPLNINSLLKEMIPVPSMDDQLDVSKAVRIWRKACEKAQSTIALLNERRTALISAAVTGKIDVRNWKPDTH